MEVQVLIEGVVLPAVLAGVIFVIGWRPWRRKEKYEGGHWSGAVAFSLAFLASFISENGLEKLQPVSKRDWIVHLALASGAIGLLVSLLRKPRWIRYLGGPLLGLAIWLTIKPIDNPTHALGGLAVLCLVAIALWAILEPLAEKRPGASLPLAFMGVFTGLAILVEKTGGLSLPIICGAMSGVCGAALAISWLNPRLSLTRGATVLLAGMPPTILWLQGWYDYSGVPAACFVLPLLAIPLLWLGELSVVTRRPPWIGVLVRATLAAIPAVIAIVLAMNVESSDPYSY